MIRLIAIAAFALAVATSAQAMSVLPLQVDGMSTEAQYAGRYRGYYRYGYGNRYGYGRYNRYRYRDDRYYDDFGYKPYAYWPYGFGRRQVRRCALWDARQDCRRLYRDAH
jgi:hypothetical protein